MQSRADGDGAAVSCALALDEAWQAALMGPAAEAVMRRARDECTAFGTPVQCLEAELLEMLSTAYYLPRERLDLALRQAEASSAEGAWSAMAGLARVVRCHVLMVSNETAALAAAAEAAAADPAVRAHPQAACVNLWHQTIGAFWGGQHERALRCAHEWLLQVKPLGLVHQECTALCAIGYLYSATALQHLPGLQLLQQAREIERGLPLNRWSPTISARCLETMLWCGQSAEALAQLQDDLRRPGMWGALHGRHATVARVFLANGDIAQAEQWLGQLGPDRPAQPFLTWQWRLAKVMLLNAQGRHREAAELAQSELTRTKPAVPPPADMMAMFQAQQAAYQAMGDLRRAEEAEAQAQVYLWPALATAARNAFIGIQLEAVRVQGGPRPPAPADPRARQVPEGRQMAIDQAVQHAQAGRVPALLAHVSHEIRSPLAGVIGLAGLLELSQLDERQRRWVNALSHSARWMLAVVNDVLDLARLQSGRVALRPVRFDWTGLLAETCALVEPLIGKKPLTLAWHVDPALATGWTGDPIRLRQVLHNLLGNAVKFTAAGSVQVRLRPAGPEAVRVEVQDTGPGIDAAAQARLFQAFEQAVPERDAAGGSGLGLMLCQQLVQLMGGRIGVVSEPGAGSLFWFEVPPLTLEPDRP